MIKSMTGYGNASKETARIGVKAEVKSLNSKFLDLGMRLPKEFSDRELEVRNIINETLERGKVSISVEIEEKGQLKPAVSINKELVKVYYQELLDTAKYVGANEDDLLRLALQLPKAVNTESEKEDNSEEWEIIRETIREAAKKCDEFRVQEGNTLQLKLKEYIQKISSSLEKVAEFDPQRIQNLRQKIQNQFEEYRMAEMMDKSRFEQELIYYIEKLDISEEKVRLKSHLDYFLQSMQGKEGSGKKLGFIAQEIGREINTIGSKANDANIQRAVVEMKEELEKIKEQVLNII